MGAIKNKLIETEEESIGVKVKKVELHSEEPYLLLENGTKFWLDKKIPFEGI